MPRGTTSLYVPSPSSRSSDNLNRAQRTRLTWYFDHPKHARYQTDSLDFWLLKRGLLTHEIRGSSRILSLTSEGLQAALHNGSTLVERHKPHDTLAERFALYLRDHQRITWTNIKLKIYHEGKKRTVRPDVFSLVTTYRESKSKPLVHEIKVSRADFLQSLRKPSIRVYQHIAERVYYVVPKGMVRKSEVPDPFGLYVETAPGRFKLVKVARKHTPRPYTYRMWMALMLKGGKHQSML